MRRGARRIGNTRHTGPSGIYDDLLQETLRQSSSNEERPLKRRKSHRDHSQPIVVSNSSLDSVKSGNDKDVVVIESSSNEISDDEEMEWGNVDLDVVPYSDDVTDTQTSPVIREVTLNSTPQKSEYIQI